MARANVSAEDRALGLDRPVARRDVLHGATRLLGAAALGGCEATAEQQAYPPLLQGLRGSHPGSFEAAHALRDGSAPWPAAAETEDGPYDLAVVGGGISGLAAAHFFRAARPGARVLLLDNHDDFGGHARRNKFRGDDGWLMLMNGGTMSIDSPRPYSAVADGLLRSLGVDPVGLERRCSDPDFYGRHGCGRGVFLELADLLAETLKLDTAGAAFEEHLRALRAAVDHHAGSEERSMFAEAQRLGEARLRELGRDLEAMLEEQRTSRFQRAFRDLKVRLLEGA